jgi:hypothetical protein
VNALRLPIFAHNFDVNAPHLTVPAHDFRMVCLSFTHVSFK